ncbi:MAG: HAMP domain-containing histidine kinase [Treponema sp.]|nr:HAMP domain-containing histidine kinase [Treponema sp.]
MKKKDVFFHLKLKNSFSILSIVGTILALFIVALDVFMFHMSNYQSQNLMDAIIKDGGEFRPDPDYMSFDRTGTYSDYFSAELDEKGNILRVIHDFTLERDDNLIQNIYAYSRKENKPRGFYHGILYFFYESPSFPMLVLIDKISESANRKRFVVFSMLIFLLSLGALFVLSWYISKFEINTIEEAFSRQKQFVSDVSHELKTPIAVIGTNISVLEQQIPKNKWLNYIKTENERMSVMVRDMLYLARDDAGALDYDMKPFDLSDMVGCAVLPFESLAFEQKKKLCLNLPSLPVTVIGDENRLKQAVIILTDNAMKNSEENAVIRITAGISGQKAFVKVYNTGHGVAPEEKEKIFNRFYRSDASRTRDTGGCGLGLSIAQAVVQRHGGKITVESEVGKYAEFTITIPAATHGTLPRNRSDILS